MPDEIITTIPIIYGVCVLLSAILLVCYLLFVKEKHVWMKLMLISVCVVNIGYFYLSLAPNLSHALMANRIAYLGNAFQPLFVFLTVANICRIKIKKAVVIGLLVFTSIMCLGACTQGVLPIFYQSVEYAIVNGVVKLVKEYAFLHSIYAAYVIAFMIIVFAMTLIAIFKKKLVFYRYIVMMVLISTINVAVWLTERFVRGNYEFLSVSYIVTCLFMVLLYAELSEHGLVGVFHAVVDAGNSTTTVPVLKTAESEKNTTATVRNFFDVELVDKICKYYTENKILTRREAEMLILLLQGLKQNEIVEKLFISKNTVKTHTSNIYSKLGVTSREELFRAVSENEQLGCLH